MSWNNHSFYFSAFSAHHGLKGNIWLARYHKSNTKTLKRLFMPKKIQKNIVEFETFLDKQSGEDSSFRIRSRVLWLDFLRSEEDRLHDSGQSVRYIIAESTGLQDQVVDMRGGSDRSTERYIFDDSSVFDSEGKPLTVNDCVFFPALSLKSSIPKLKGFRCD